MRHAAVELAPWIFFFRGALGIAVSRGPGGLEQAAVPADLPDELLEAWELADRDGLPAGRSRAAAVPARARVRAQPSQQAPDPIFAGDLDPSIVNLTSDGVCHTSPLRRTVIKAWQKIHSNILSGREIAAGMKILFAGLIRNAEAAVPGGYAMWRQIGMMFSDYHFILFENDSTDDTVKQLRLIAQQDEKFEFQSHTLELGFERGLEMSRMKRMAQLRNMLQDSIREFVQSRPGWDMIAMYDFDLNLFSEHVVFPHTILNMLGRTAPGINDWDMICANSLRHHDNDPSQPIGYHDCFAFRTPENDSFMAGCEAGMASKLYDGYDPVPVHSCFGGLAVYKASSYLGCRYDPDAYDCEHVPLHRCMRERGSEQRMFMDPLMTTTYGSDIRQLCTTQRERIKEILGFSQGRPEGL